MSNTTITKTDDGDFLVVPVRRDDTKVYLQNRLYASMNASTDTPASEDHRLSIKLDDEGCVNLHFEPVYLCMSEADWDRVVAGVAQARAAKAVSA